MQDPDAATREVVRCIRELGFRGALVNGFSQVGDPETVVYCDDSRYAAFWDTLEELDVPFYLHPRNPLRSWAQIYDGHDWLLGPTWAFGQETAVHALRLMCSGLFDPHPGLTLIFGHLGEGLPYNAWRIDHRLRKMPRVFPGAGRSRSKSAPTSFSRQAATSERQLSSMRSLKSAPIGCCSQSTTTLKRPPTQPSGSTEHRSPSVIDCVLLRKRQTAVQAVVLQRLALSTGRVPGRADEWSVSECVTILGLESVLSGPSQNLPQVT
jgi:hypothetical protein